MAILDKIVKPMIAGLGITSKRLGHSRPTVMYPEDKREQSKRRAYVKFRRVALLEEIETFRAESKRVNANLKGRAEPDQAA